MIIHKTILTLDASRLEVDLWAAIGLTQHTRIYHHIFANQDVLIALMHVQEVSHLCLQENASLRQPTAATPGLDQASGQRDEVSVEGSSLGQLRPDSAGGGAQLAGPAQVSSYASGHFCLHVASIPCM